MTNRVRPVRIEGSLAFVPLTQGFEAVIDAEDAPSVSAYNWCALRAPKTIYAVRISSRCSASRRLVYLHREITGVSDDLSVDHIDCDGLNCRKENLRLATVAQNNLNQGLRRDNSSGFKGVSFDRRSAKWVARIRVNLQRISLGYFSNKEDAAAAYADACRSFHGEFGRTA